MLVEPAAIAVTKPDEAFTVATAVLLLDHEPEPPLKTTVFAVYVAFPEVHNGEVPETDPIEATGFTIIVPVAFTDPHPPVSGML